MKKPNPVQVVAGALYDAEGRVLIAQRPRGRHMAGRWEFPGGKLVPGESPGDGLRRELSEELGIEVRVARPLFRLRHAYPDRVVVLDVWRVSHYDGEPRGLDGQQLLWVAPDELPGQDLLEADRAIVTALRLPHCARVITSDARLGASGGPEPEALLWQVQATTIGPNHLAQVRKARDAGHRVFVLGDSVDAVRLAAVAGADGAVLDWHNRHLDVDPEGRFLVGVRCEDEESAIAAAGAGAQFLVVSVQGEPLPEPQLARLCAAVGIPVFAGWYRDANRLGRLRTAGAHGCAIDVGLAVEARA